MNTDFLKELQKLTAQLCKDQERLTSQIDSLNNFVAGDMSEMIGSLQNSVDETLKRTK